jgi:hypothetical protein
MATKSQLYRAEQERARQHHNQETAHVHEKRLTHNDARRVNHKASYAIEENSGRPSRKSTRASSNRAKPDSALRITARIRNASPEARATRKSGNPT